MTTQSENSLEQGLIRTLQENSYEYVEIKEEENLRSNFKLQLEKHNRKALEEVGRTGFTEAEFDKIIESGLYRLYADYENVIAFTAKQNCESMFESVKISDPNNVWNNFTMLHLMTHYRTDKLVDNCCTNAGLAGLGWGFLSPQKNLYEDFVAVEGVDGYRLNATMKTWEQMVDMGINVKEGNTIINEGYFMWKTRITAEQVPAAGSNFVDDANRQWMRYAEVLLCAAEAHFEAGNKGKADEYMNMIRTRAQAPTKSGYTIDEIRREPDDLWTVAELIEALQQCPPDYRIALTAHGLPSVGLATLGIDTVREAVNLFAE